MANKFEKVSFEQFCKDIRTQLHIKDTVTTLVEDTFRVMYNVVKKPVRETIDSAGYDIVVPYTVTIPAHGGVIIPSGLKCQIESGMYLMLLPRSSVGIKNNCILANTVGVIDKDYYNNQDNEGHILMALYNYGIHDIKFEAGKAVVQGIFSKYYKTEDDFVTKRRSGGIGSTDNGNKTDKALFKF